MIPRIKAAIKSLIEDYFPNGVEAGPVFVDEFYIDLMFKMLALLAYRDYGFPMVSNDETTAIRRTVLFEIAYKLISHYERL